MPNDLPSWLKLIKGDMTAGDDAVEMLLAEPIGFDPNTFEGMSSNRFGAVLNSIPKAKPIKLNINTLGGNVDDGTAMYNMIRARGNVDTCVIGYAASMGAVIHQGGRMRYMMPGTMLILHNPQNVIAGEASQLEKQAEILRIVKGNLVDLMASRSGAGKRAISDMMDAVTALNPKDALAAGFCDEIVQGSAATNDFSYIFDNFRRLNGSVAGGGNQADKTTNREQRNNKYMKLTDTLVMLGLISAASLADEDAASQVKTNFDRLKAERDTLAGQTNTLKTEKETLKTENDSHREALKLRVTNRVKQAITDKVVKPEREASLIQIGLQAEANLDFLDDARAQMAATSAAAGGQRRGAPPVPNPAKPASGSADEVEGIRNDLKNPNLDPVERATLARKLSRAQRPGLFTNPMLVEPEQN